MDLEVLTGYILEHCLVLIPALWVIGALMKNTPKVPNWLIPYVLLVCGVVGACFLVGLTVDGVVQGVLVAGVAVLGHQLLKQASQKE